MGETPDAAPPPLGGTRWVLVELEGVPVELEEGAREPYLEFDLEESQLAGSGGVNRLVGSF
ncbi:MAG TPA: META domain-containing protein, partial [Gaiellaceae bacterium]|nr:META domain-containing protein [Gaiellaceae bacterium]